MQARGYSFIELLITLGIAAIVITIAGIAYVGYQRSTQTVDSLATISIMRERLNVSRGLSGEQLLTCDNSLTRPGDLDDLYVDLRVVALPLDEADLAKGYGGGVAVAATIDQHGNNGIVAAQQLYEELTGEGADIRNATLTDSATNFSVLLTSSTQPHCEPPTAVATATPATQLAPGQTPAATTGSQVPAGAPAAQPPALSFSFTTTQEVVEFDNTGTGSVITNGRLKTNGPIRDLALEFNVMGGQQVATSGIHGATFLSYGADGNQDEFYVWRPDDLTVRVGGTEYRTGIDTTADGDSHRYSILWSSDTGTLQVLVDGAVEFQQQNIATGYEIPGDGILALAQDQDRYAYEDGTGVNHGFNPGDAFHGQYFSASMASAAVDPADLTDKTLASVVDPANGLITDIRMQNGGAVDLTGNHQLTTVGDVTSRRVEVDTSIATPNPGATLDLSIDVAPKGQDQLLGLFISGLLPGTQLSDGAGNSATSASQDVTNWDYQNITAVLPQGVVENMRIVVTASVTGPAGDQATASAERALVLDPSKPIP